VHKNDALFKVLLKMMAVIHKYSDEIRKQDNANLGTVDIIPKC
jgi:hypothetical protein